MRAAFDRSEKGRTWADYAIVGGSFLLAAAIVLTLVIVSHVDARANRLIEANDRRSVESPAILDGFRGQLAGIAADLDGIEHRLDLLVYDLATPTTTTTRPRPTTTTRRPTPTTTTRPPRPTTTTRPPATSTTRPGTTTTTTRPCEFAILTLCLYRPAMVTP